MRVLGMISGTSHDGIDMAVVDFHHAGGGLTATILAVDCVAYSPGLRTRLIAMLPPANTTLAEVCAIDTLIGHEFAAAACQIIEKVGGVDAICSHGQTVFHWVEDGQALGTWQIGQPAWIAEATGCPVVFDVRARDLTAGGQGAPLASLIDYLLLRGSGTVAAALNLGGIANMTVVTPDGVSGFDIGPANTLLDATVVAHHLNTQGFDPDAAIASRGVINQELLAVLLADPYYAEPAPKSTGKEYFNAAYVAKIEADWPDLTVEDLMATLAQLTVRTVGDAVKEAGASHLYVSGGGARNPLIMAGLRRELPSVEVRSSDALGVPSDAKEAVLMALIGWCTMHGVPATVPGGTGASRPSLLGSITPGSGPLILPPPVPGLESIRFVPAGAPVTLRTAGPTDLTQIVQLFLGCWQGSYAEVLPSSVITAMTLDQATAMWRNALAAAGTMLVAEQAGQIVGVTRFCIDEQAGYVPSLYVAPAAQGTGVGRLLLDAAERWFRDQGLRTAKLWVFAANEPGIGFYRSRGWAPDGATRVEPQFGEPEVRLSKPMASR
ncbi:MAG: anhydro-N-acetylmuramic acid kinase [Propionibacteriaceae bacterium]|nr:anhydro-N-acetylmuramic acid kinase [Propionibacteriaceae bacterium]